MREREREFQREGGVVRKRDRDREREMQRERERDVERRRCCETERERKKYRPMLGRGERQKFTTNIGSLSSPSRSGGFKMPPKKSKYIIGNSVPQPKRLLTLMSVVKCYDLPPAFSPMHNWVIFTP